MTSRSYIYIYNIYIVQHGFNGDTYNTLGFLTWRLLHRRIHGVVVVEVQRRRVPAYPWFCSNVPRHTWMPFPKSFDHHGWAPLWWKCCCCWVGNRIDPAIDRWVLELSRRPRNPSLRAVHLFDVNYRYRYCNCPVNRWSTLVPVSSWNVVVGTEFGVWFLNTCRFAVS